jgi:cytochrome c553
MDAIDYSRGSRNACVREPGFDPGHAARLESRGFANAAIPVNIRTMRTTTILGALALSLAATSALAQGEIKGDVQKAKGKVSLCIGCHGIPDYRTAYPEVYRVPMIAGQNAAYIVKALQAYRAGDRGHPSMRAIARSLSDQDMADVAVYYATAK